MLAQSPSHLSNEAKEIALRNAAKNKQWTIVSILLKAGVSTNVNDEKNSIFKINSGHWYYIEKILGCIHKAGAGKIPANDKDNILCLAAWHGKPHLVSDMLAQTPNHLTDKAKEKALWNAVNKDNWTTVSILLNAGISTNVNDEKNSIFKIPDGGNTKDILDYIHKAGVSKIPANDRDNILCLAAWHGKPQLVSDMLTQTPNHLTDKTKEKALWNAVNKDNWTTVSILLNAGISTNVNDEKNSIFKIPSGGNTKDILDYIHKAGVSNIPAKDKVAIFNLAIQYKNNNLAIDIIKPWIIQELSPKIRSESKEAFVNCLSLATKSYLIDPKAERQLPEKFFKYLNSEEADPYRTFQRSTFLITPEYASLRKHIAKCLLVMYPFTDSNVQSIFLKSSVLLSLLLIETLQEHWGKVVQQEVQDKKHEVIPEDKLKVKETDSSLAEKSKVDVIKSDSVLTREIITPKDKYKAKEIDLSSTEPKEIKEKSEVDSTKRKSSDPDPAEMIPIVSSAGSINNPLGKDKPKEKETDFSFSKLLTSFGITSSAEKPKEPVVIEDHNLKSTDTIPTTVSSVGSINSPPVKPN